MAFSLIQQIRDRQGSFAVGSIITIVLNSFSILVSVGTSILIARRLGPEEVGILLWFVQGTIMIALYADVLGIYYSNIYLSAKETHDFEAATIRATILTYGLIVGLITGAVFGFLTPVRTLIFRGYASNWSVLIALSVLGLVLLNQVQGLLLGKRQFLFLGLLKLAQAVLYAVLGLIVLLGLGWQSGDRIAIAHVTSTWLALVGSLFVLIPRGIKSPMVGYLRACMDVGWRATVINWVSYLHTRADQYLVNTLLGPTSLGFYGVSVSLGEALTRVPGMLGTVLFPTVALEKNRSQAARRTLKSVFIVMMLVAVVAIMVALLAPSIVELLYGQEFLGAVAPLRALLPAAVFLSGLALINNHLAGWGYPPILLISMGLGVSINIVGNLWLLPQIGVVGAAISSSVTYGIQFIIVLIYLLRQLNEGHDYHDSERSLELETVGTERL